MAKDNDTGDTNLDNLNGSGNSFKKNEYLLWWFLFLDYLDLSDRPINVNGDMSPSLVWVVPSAGEQMNMNNFIDIPQHFQSIYNRLNIIDSFIKKKQILIWRRRQFSWIRSISMVANGLRSSKTFVSASMTPLQWFVMIFGIFFECSDCQKRLQEQLQSLQLVTAFKNKKFGAKMHTQSTNFDNYFSR